MWRLTRTRSSTVFACTPATGRLSRAHCILHGSCRTPFQYKEGFAARPCNSTRIFLLPFWYHPPSINGSQIDRPQRSTQRSTELRASHELANKTRPARLFTQDLILACTPFGQPRVGLCGLSGRLGSKLALLRPPRRLPPRILRGILECLRTCLRGLGFFKTSRSAKLSSIVLLE